MRTSNDRHSLHRVLTRICTLPPRLADHLITSFSNPGDLVLDPFCGKGTIPLQACIAGRIGVGTDISPEAICSTRAAVRAPSLADVESAISDRAVLVAGLARDSRNKAESAAQPESVRQLYHASTLAEIIAWRTVLTGDRSDSAAFIRGLLLGILHGKGNDFLSLRCSHSYSMSPGYVKRYVHEHGLQAPLRNVGQCLLHRAKLVLEDGPPPAKGSARVADARTLSLTQGPAHLILTSPPYFSVHRYARDNWLRLWFLGFPDYRDVQRTMIQTSDVHRYREHMKKSLRQMHQALRPKGRALILVGDVTLRAKSGPTIIKTANLLAADALDVGFKCEAILSDAIPHALKVAGYMAANGGISTERLIVLRR